MRPVPLPLVIDTDPGVDDALAILLALASPELDLKLVTTVHGNVELERTTENALRVLALADLLMSSPEPVTVAAAEFNVWADAEAAQRVFTAGLPTLMVGLDVTLPTVLTAEGIDRFRAAGPIGATAAAILQHYLAEQTARTGEIGVVVHDALALTEAILPGTLGTVRRDVVVDTGLGTGRGQSLVDRRTVSNLPTAVEVAETVDSPAAVEFLVSRLSSLDRA
jgi:pyrimidine-specific ribonucleoside hydrolase